MIPVFELAKAFQASDHAATMIGDRPIGLFKFGISTLKYDFLKHL
jgi:hypothetical protein